MRRVLLGAVCAVGLAGGGTPVRGESPVSLAEAVEKVLGRSPGLASASAQARERRWAGREAKRLRWPSVRLQSAVTRGDGPVYVFGSLLQQKSFGAENFALDFLNNPPDRTNVRSAVEVGLPVFAGHELSDGERLAGLGMAQAESRLASAVQRTRFETVDLGLKILALREKIRRLDERLADVVEDIESARRLKEKGLVLGSDYYAAEAIQSGLSAWRVRWEKELRAMEKSLNVLAGGETWLAGALNEEFVELLPDGGWEETALKNREELRQAELGREMAEVSLRRAGRSILPRVEAFASVESNTRNFENNPTDRMVGLRATMALGDPAYSARRRRAAAHAEAAAAQRNETEERVSLEALQQWESLQGAVESLPLLKGLRERARKSLEMFRPLYREGRQSIIEVLRAEEALAMAESSYVDALYQIHSGQARLLLAAGRLDGAAVAALDRRLEARP
ncbi:MAG TPA: TolC family protein [Elusimicrobiota bacterium]|nr:TolC family protein [Elusimicrobiota bacterium]